MNKELIQIENILRDERSKKVIFVSHCILNENTRYLGGAFCSGINSEILKELSDLNCGIVQMPCPEQIAWGGVLKKLTWLPFNSKGKPSYLLLRFIYPFFIGYTHIRYSIIASRIITQIQDYINSGFEIIGIVGIDGSPTCGVNTNLSLLKSFQYNSALTIDSLNRAQYNNNLFTTCLEPGSGIFINILTNKLARKEIKIKMLSINIKNEMHGKKMKLG